MRRAGVHGPCARTGHVHFLLLSLLSLLLVSLLSLLSSLLLSLLSSLRVLLGSSSCKGLAQMSFFHGSAIGEFMDTAPVVRQYSRSMRLAMAQPIQPFFAKASKRFHGMLHTSQGMAPPSAVSGLWVTGSSFQSNTLRAQNAHGVTGTANSRLAHLTAWRTLDHGEGMYEYATGEVIAVKSRPEMSPGGSGTPLPAGKL